MRMIGLVVAATGLILLVFGLNAADSPGEQVAYAVTGRYSDATLWYLVSGIAALVAGALLAAFGPRRL
jgi:Protein of unknown function (DUF3185)